MTYALSIEIPTIFCETPLWFTILAPVYVCILHENMYDCNRHPATMHDRLINHIQHHFVMTQAACYGDVRMGAIASQITSLTVVYSTVYSDADQRKHQYPASLATVWGIHRGPVNSPHKWPVTRKMFPFDDVIMGNLYRVPYLHKCINRVTSVICVS